jgi:hypothetical protein
VRIPRASSSICWCLRQYGVHGNRIEPLLVDRASVDHADAIDAQLDPAERGPHLIEDLGVGFGEDEVLRSRLVDHRLVAVPRLIVSRLARVRELMPQLEAELTLQLEQSLFVSLDVHLLSGYRNFKRPLFIDKKSTAGRVSCQARASSVKAVPKTLVFENAGFDGSTTLNRGRQ